MPHKYKLPEHHYSVKKTPRVIDNTPPPGNLSEAMTTLPPLYTQNNSGMETPFTEMPGNQEVNRAYASRVKGESVAYQKLSALRQNTLIPLHPFQPKAPSSSIYYLHKTHGYHSLVLKGEKNTIYKPSGVYDFIVDQDLNIKTLDNHDEKMGHTSIRDGGEPVNVLFAGRVHLDNGKLLSWDQMSGHYRTRLMNAYIIKESRLSNILPMEKYKHVFW